MTSPNCYRSSLRICCFASSRFVANKTPGSYLRESRKLGELIAQKGHLCINGGGKLGCMGALSEGVKEFKGKIRAVIHHMWVVDQVEFKDADETVIAYGNNLQERKRLLWEECDCIVVLPGGTGTWDELWEVACHNSIGLGDMPIALINVDGYYDGFVAQVERAKKDGLLYDDFTNMFFVAETAEEGLNWCLNKAEKVQQEKNQPKDYVSKTTSIEGIDKDGKPVSSRLRIESREKKEISSENKIFGLPKSMALSGILALGVSIGFTLSKLNIKM